MSPIGEFFGRAFDFKGRTARKLFWLTALIIGIPEAIVLGAADGGGEAAQGLAGLLVLLSFVPWLALSVRRLHDTNRSGWWCLIQLTGIGGIVLLVWHLQSGTQGQNKFGPDPLNRPDPNSTETSQRLDQLQRLSTLRDQGLLTEEEFAAEKGKLLGLS